MPTNNNDELGKKGKRHAERYLTGRGLTVVDRDWQSPLGTVDLVMRDGDEHVFVIIKIRSSVTYGHPLEAITVATLARLRRIAGAWCAAHPGTGRIRIDAVSVVVPRRSPATVEHLERVF